jgi:hypothetical protein
MAQKLFSDFYRPVEDELERQIQESSMKSTEM